MRTSTATFIPHDESVALSAESRANTARQSRLLVSIRNAVEAGDVASVKRLAEAL